MSEHLVARLRVVGCALQLAAILALLGVAAVPAGLLVQAAHARFGVVGAAFAVPFAYAAWGVAYCALVVVLKHAIRHRVQAGVFPFFSLTVAKWAFVGMLVVVAEAMFVRFVIGTDFIVWWYRALGATIGERVTINTTSIGDWDLLTIGDDVFIAAESKILGHTGEMGKLKISPTTIGDRCTVGLGAVLFGGVTLHDGAVLGALAVTQKGATFEAETIYGGVPAKQIRRRAAGEGSALEEARKAA